MKYKTIQELDSRIERIVRKKIECYYTDWKNYDRPYYMQLKGSDRREDKKLLLIVRTCGSYLYTLEQLKTYEFAATVYEYYYTQDHGDYYIIDLDRLSIEKIDPAEYKRQITLYKAA